VDDAGVAHHFLDNNRGWATVDAGGIAYNGRELNHDNKFQVSSLKFQVKSLRLTKL
jgi:hypothetical protein